MKQKSLTGFMNEVIEELCQQERFATAHIYTYALRAFTEFEVVAKSSSVVSTNPPSGISSAIWKTCNGATTPSPRTYVRCGQCITVR